MMGSQVEIGRSRRPPTRGIQARSDVQRQEDPRPADFRAIKRMLLDARFELFDWTQPNRSLGWVPSGSSPSQSRPSQRCDPQGAPIAADLSVDARRFARRHLVETQWVGRIALAPGPRPVEKTGEGQ